MALVNVRLHGSSERALEELTSDGTTVSEAVRQALVDSARLRRRMRMRAEALRAMEDPNDRAAVRRVMDEWADVSSW